MEERGWGFNKMRNLLLEHGLNSPSFDYDSGYFLVTFFGHEQTFTPVKIASGLLLQLNNRQKEIIDFIQKHGKVTSSKYAKQFNINQRTAIRDLKILIELGVIEKMGSGPNIYYKLV